MAMAAAVGLQIQVLKIGTQLFPEARQERHWRSSSGSASVSFRGRFDDRYGALRPCGCGNVMDLRIQFRFGHRIPDGGAGWYRGLLESRPHSLKSQVSFGKSKVSWLCRGNQQDSGFCLHDLMDQAGIETAFARVARTGFSKEVAKLAGQNEEAGGDGDLARAVLEIAAEDDALVSHSAVPLPVDMYLERLDSMASEFAGHHLPSQDPRNPSAILEALDKYLYIYKGFQRTSTEASRDPRDFYLNGVLTRRLGTPVMLGLIYSEVVKRLKLRGAVEFLVQLQLPKVGTDLWWPQAIVKEAAAGDLEDSALKQQKAGTQAAGMQQNLLTSEVVLSEVLRSLKSLYWPWKPENGVSEESGFLDAATAINRGPVSSGSSVHGPFESLFTAPSRSRGSDVARARAAQYRLQRGIWTSTAFGDLRCALAASERLVILGVDRMERRDYGVLLFHCGLYEQAFQYLNSHLTSEASATAPAHLSSLEAKEIVALKQLLERLTLILTERSWDNPQPPHPIASPPEPW
ncbi:hypothetical protein MPTK1_3g01470 [Marchantia polymorpha subsp. ruderalis]|uniref:Protein SirB1 N-terminal domain-containing protein n=2 Tax=Marchantia polymorpha TaxID=3197 RepID=A0A176VN11_MARPO|nr:hypothetical protein AXG93_4012s1060 [Marchantia polymorpha subsp. ruderalis]PTQ47738.1 hypothetical protein MARPO_0007s0139 [Marchantia polymorpha]BBN04051.1 hypothetical protein Mp_3g01470 [Marchantia polymorpha subsp. ruderalis]|eukprot:PTQ47738.1 hypothetical protein MARPO_0007s0139 [Marchantia polymorpha]